MKRSPLQRTIFIVFLLIFLLTAVPLNTTAGPFPDSWNSLDWQTIPWEKSPEFLKVINNEGTPIRMAFFSATLHDPLPGEWFNVSHAANLLSGTIVKPGEIFSQNRKLGPYTFNKGYKSGPTYSGDRIITTIGGGVCKIASLLYNVVTLSNLQVIERHNHSLTVPYVPPGQDATVYYGVFDFKFRNNTKGPVLIWAKTYGNTLYMALYGQQTPPKVTWRHETLKKINTQTIVRYNPNLHNGSEKVLMPGQDGIVVRSWVTVRYPDGREETRDLGMDNYAPSPRIIEKGPSK